MDVKKRQSLIGLSFALLIMLCWGGTLFSMFFLAPAELSIPAVLAVMAWQTFLFTGLFITAHDAMHGGVYPLDARVNNFIGTLAVIGYALFSYQKLHAKHWEHHRHPASEHDPDFHDGKHPQFWRWYSHFMLGYLSWKQLLGMALVFNLLEHMLQVPPQRLLLFWVLPALLSTLQLFYFGTYLPHRDSGDYPDEHRARSNNYPVFWSFLTCYHFGYHREHHAWPHVPWWQLPSVRKERDKAA